MIEELKLCPFCGGKAIKVTKPLGICSLPAIRCENEDCSGDSVVVGSSYAEASEQWNTRPVEDALLDRAAQWEDLARRLSADTMLQEKKIADLLHELREVKAERNTALSECDRLRHELDKAKAG